MAYEYEKGPMVKLFSLWDKRNHDGTKRYWTGICGGVKYIMFRSKSSHPQAPMFDVYVTPFQRKRNDDTKPAAPSTKDDDDDFRPQPDPAPTGPAVQDGEGEEKDEELPF